MQTKNQQICATSSTSSFYFPSIVVSSVGASFPLNVSVPRFFVRSRVFWHRHRPGPSPEFGAGTSSTSPLKRPAAVPKLCRPAGGAETATSSRCRQVGKGPVPAGQEYVSLGNISCHTFTPPAESLERSGGTGELQFWAGQRRRRRWSAAGRTGLGASGD